MTTTQGEIVTLAAVETAIERILTVKYGLFPATAKEAGYLEGVRQLAAELIGTIDTGRIIRRLQNPTMPF